MFFPSFPLLHFPFPLCYLLLLRSREPGWTAEREAENASRPPLPCAAPRRTALAGSHHSPWWGSETSRRRGEKVGRSAGVRGQYWTSLWADKPGRPGRNRGRSRRASPIVVPSCKEVQSSEHTWAHHLKDTPGHTTHLGCYLGPYLPILQTGLPATRYTTNNHIRDEV